MNIGIIGLDTSHCEVFARLLNDHNDPYHIKGAKVIKAIPFFSPDLPISANRAERFTERMKSQYNVKIVEDISTFCEKLDGILLTAVDGDTHLEWIKKLASYKIPIFIDKPIAYSISDLNEIKKLADLHHVPIMSSSSLRYAESFVKLLEDTDKKIQSAYVYGPLPMQEGIPGYFWYGIHLIEMVIALMGTDIKDIQVERYESYELCHLQFSNGRHVVIRGEYESHNYFGMVGHVQGNTYKAELWTDKKPYYAGLMEKIIPFFRTGISPIPWEETKAIVSIIEEINDKRNN